jgi:hypothetical protein
MPTLRRILKYTPAVIMVLLVVAWVVSLCLWNAVYEQSGGYQYALAVDCGEIAFSVDDVQRRFPLPQGWFWNPHTVNLEYSRSVLGALRMSREDSGTGWIWGVEVPFPLLITCIAPLSLGPFISYRFRLWQYLAFTALIALELAYYLRWQE